MMMTMMLRLPLALLLLLSPHVVQARVTVSPLGSDRPFYTNRDNVGWAVTSPDHLKFAHHQKMYNTFMKECEFASGGTCQGGEDFRLKMNRLQPSGVYNFTQTGFTKIKTPKRLFQLITDFWEANKERTSIEWKSVNSYHNMWTAPPWFVSMEDPNNPGGGDLLQKAVWKEARPVLEEWTGMRLSPVSMYGVRIYKNSSILAPHVDRMPLVTSCIINVDQDLDEDWPLEVFDHNGKAHNVSMEPGDMVLYESHSVIHGRPFPMKGRAYVNVFLHFEPIGPLDEGIEKSGPHENGLPPYVIPGGNWEEEYFKTTDKWKVKDHVPSALIRGDYRALEYAAYAAPETLTQKDYNGWRPIHEAAYRGDIDGVKFLLENGASVTDRIGKDGDTPGHNVYELAQVSPYLDALHPILDFLAEQMDSEGEEL